MRSTADFKNTFGDRRAAFQGLIVAGKDMKLSAQEQDRLKWRMDRTLIDSNHVSCISFDGLCDDLDQWLNNYYGV
ncbi:MAG: Shedu anti-phage system protein SduA domain-containing protein [Polyangiaceae bacterium]